MRAMHERSHPLSPRQWQVLALIAAGRANKEIAAELGIGLDTVKDHVRAIFQKVEVTSRIAAALWYAEFVTTRSE